MTKYAPANEAGDKPYVVEKAGWGRRQSMVVYALNASAAEYRALRRLGNGEYITGCRRATPEDVEGTAK